MHLSDHFPLIAELYAALCWCISKNLSNVDCKGKIVKNIKGSEYFCKILMKCCPERHYLNLSTIMSQADSAGSRQGEASTEQHCHR